MTVSSLTDLAAELASGAGGTGVGARPSTRGAAGPDGDKTDGAAFMAEAVVMPLLEAIRAREADFAAARRRGDATAMVEATLALDDELWSWRADTLQSDEFDRGRASVRAMVGELGRLAQQAMRDPSEAVGPFVELSLSLRESARSDGRFADADAIRDRLNALGVEVRDGTGSSSWELTDQADRPAGAGNLPPP